MTQPSSQSATNLIRHAPPILLSSPVMTREKFSLASGLREGQVRGQIERGHLPVFYVGRLAMVNVALLAWKELDLVPCPVMTKDAFAKASGLREQQVESQLERGNLPIKPVGRLCLVDVSELVRQCISQEHKVVPL